MIEKKVRDKIKSVSEIESSQTIDSSTVLPILSHFPLLTLVQKSGSSMATLSLSLPPETTKEAFEKPADIQGPDRGPAPVEEVVEAEAEAEVVLFCGCGCDEVDGDAMCVSMEKND